MIPACPDLPADLVWSALPALQDGRAAALAVREEERWLLAEDCELVVGQLRAGGGWRRLVFLRGRPGAAWDGLLQAVDLSPCSQALPSTDPLAPGRWVVEPVASLRCGWPLDAGAFGRDLGAGPVPAEGAGPGAVQVGEPDQPGWLVWSGAEGQAALGPIPPGSVPLGVQLRHQWWSLPAEPEAPARLLGLAQRRGGEPRWTVQVWGLGLPAVAADRQGLTLTNGQRILWPQVRS